MSNFCGTRAIQNAKRIRRVAPQVFPAVEPLEGFASVLPLDVLHRFHRMSDEELRQYPQLLEAATILRGTPQTPQSSRPQAESAHDVEDALFHGTLHLLKITFQVGTTSFAVSDADLGTILQYMVLALPAIAKYASQYGENQVGVASQIEELTVDVSSTGGKYTLDMLEAWIRPVAHRLDPQSEGGHALVVCNPPGVTNSDADPSKGVGGYHDTVEIFPPHLDVPYCFINVDTISGSLTLQDTGGSPDHHQYALALSHETAEMIVNPLGKDGNNPEVCDACAGGCAGVNWHAFFAVTSPGEPLRYLHSATAIPPAPFSFDFFIAAVTWPSVVDNCPPPHDFGCNYGPDARPGLSQLLFYEQASGYEELHSVDVAGNLALQTTNPFRGDGWSLIVPGRYTYKPAASPLDLLYYKVSHGDLAGPTGFGSCFQTGSLGDMVLVDQTGRWRPSWSMIIPGKFCTPPYPEYPFDDLLFYDAGAGLGEFYHTDGGGLAFPSFATYTDWRPSWSIIKRI